MLNFVEALKWVFKVLVQRTRVCKYFVLGYQFSAQRLPLDKDPIPTTESV